jgi:hypothetical protein
MVWSAPPGGGGRADRRARGLPSGGLALLVFVGAVALTPPALASDVISVEQHRPHDIVLQASVPGNPYEVELTGELRGPDGTLEVRGFHDGEDRWVFRVAAPRPGAWVLRTQSNVPALSGRVRKILVRPAPASSPARHGPIQIDPRSPRHFRFADGTPFFLMGYEADWLWGADMLDPERTVMNRLLDQMVARGFNYVLVNVYAHDTRWAPGKSCQWDYGPPALYAFGGSNEAPEHGVINARFFQAYDGMMWALWRRGIVAHVMIKVYNKAVSWPKPRSPEERRFFQYVVARYAAFTNIVWDFAKEAKKEPDDALEHELLSLVRSEDPYDRLVTLHDDPSFFWEPKRRSLLDFETHQFHVDHKGATVFNLARSSGPLLNAEFGYEHGVEPLPTHTHPDQSDWKELLRRAWLVTLAGSHPVYYYNNTAWDIVKPDPEPPGMARWQLLKEILTALPYRRMKPHDQIAHGAVCLAAPGRHYVCHLAGDEVTVDLRALRGEARLTWIDSWSGARAEGVRVASGVHALRRPARLGDGPAVLVIQHEAGQ